MNDIDLPAFMDLFRRVTRIFPVRGESDDVQDMSMAYFKALRFYPLEAVSAGADVYISRGKFFPKPGQWIESIPKARTRPELKQLLPREVSDYLRAERLKYQSEDPCHCDPCRQAGVDHRFSRFVPEFDEGQDARVLIGDREVTRGHWAHGEELKRYYSARDGFWGAFGSALDRKALTKKKRAQVPFKARLEAIYAKREPEIDALDPVA